MKMNGITIWVVGLLLLGSLIGIVIYNHMRSHELQIVAVYQCSPLIQWQIKRGPIEKVYGEGSSVPNLFQYQSLSLILSGKEVYRVDNGVDFWALWGDTLNDLPHLGFNKFSTGAPIIAALAYDMASIAATSTDNETDVFLDGPFGVVITAKSGLTVDQFLVAAHCLFDRRDELHDEFANLAGKPHNVGKISWLALTDDSVIPFGGEDVSIPGDSQAFICENGYKIGTQGNIARLLAPGEPWSSDEYINGKPFALIDAQGRLLQQDTSKTSSQFAPPFPDHRTIDMANVPVDISACVNSKGVTFRDFLQYLPVAIHYYANE